MNKKKLLKLIRAFFVLFSLSGVGTIMDYYYGVYSQMFTKLFNLYDFFRLGHVDVKMPGLPFILILLTVAVFLVAVRRLYKRITIEIQKEN